MRISALRMRTAPTPAPRKGVSGPSLSRPSPGRSTRGRRHRGQRRQLGAHRLPPPGFEDIGAAREARGTGGIGSAPRAAARARRRRPDRARARAVPKPPTERSPLTVAAPSAALEVAPEIELEQYGSANTVSHARSRDPSRPARTDCRRPRRASALRQRSRPPSGGAVSSGPPRIAPHGRHRRVHGVSCWFAAARTQRLRVREHDRRGPVRQRERVLRAPRRAVARQVAGPCRERAVGWMSRRVDVQGGFPRRSRQPAQRRGHDGHGASRGLRQRRLSHPCARPRLDDKRFQAMADGDIDRRMPGDAGATAHVCGPVTDGRGTSPRICADSCADRSTAVSHCITRSPAESDLMGDNKIR